MSTTTATAPIAHRLQDSLPYQDSASSKDDDSPVVLTLNGGMMTHAAWAPVTDGLLGGHRLLGCDFFGQLLSPGEGHPRLEDHVHDVVTLLDTLELESVHVLGTSFGGEVGLILAAQHPDRVRSLAAVTAVDRTPKVLADNARAMAVITREVLAGADTAHFNDTLAQDVYSDAHRETHRSEIAERRHQRLPDIWYQGLLNILHSVEDFDLSSYLGRITCPTLVVHAANDSVMPRPRVEALAQGIPNARFVVHPTSGHALVLEDPAWLSERYRQFLGGLED